MKKKELKITGLSYSQSQLDSYVVVLSDVSNQYRKLPIIINSIEAQKIASEIEEVKSSRPMIYDLLKNLTDFYKIKIKEIYIHRLVEGVFHTRMTTFNDKEEVDIECSVGDGISISSIYKCPIYVSSDILESVGVNVDDYGNVIVEEFEKIHTEEPSLEDLNNMIKEAIENEEYEIAAELRDKIKKIKSN